MFLRHKRIGKYTYVYLVESVYQDGRTRQHITPIEKTGSESN